MNIGSHPDRRRGRPPASPTCRPSRGLSGEPNTDRSSPAGAKLAAAWPPAGPPATATSCSSCSGLALLPEVRVERRDDPGQGRPAQLHGTAGNDSSTRRCTTCWTPLLTSTSGPKPRPGPSPAPNYWPRGPCCAERWPCGTLTWIHSTCSRWGCSTDRVAGCRMRSSGGAYFSPSTAAPRGMHNTGCPAPTTHRSPTADHDSDAAMSY